jgi:predicted transcriptional regulator
MNETIKDSDLAMLTINRQKIIRDLSMENGMTLTRITKLLKITMPAAWETLGVLIKSGIVVKDKNKVYYLTPKGKLISKFLQIWIDD